MQLDYINILNDVIEKTIKEKNFKECKKFIDEAKKYNYSEDIMSLIYRASALAHFEEGNCKESLKDAENAILFYDKININEKKDEMKEKKIVETIIICYNKSYNDFI